MSKIFRKLNFKSLLAASLERFMRAEYDKWGKVVRDTGAAVN